MGFNEKVHAYIAAKFYVHMTECFGERGRQAFIHATRHYAMQRGRRMAQRAIRDGVELTQSAYNQYGEWSATEEIIQAGCQNQAEYTPEGWLKITRCPWHDQFQEMGCAEAGKAYCQVLDSAISAGFNPELGYKVDQTLHTGDCCIHRLESGFIGEGSGLGKKTEYIKPFEYHCAHAYWAYSQVAEAVFRAGGVKVSGDVLREFGEDYGAEMADALMKYRFVDFDVCD